MRQDRSVKNALQRERYRLNRQQKLTQNRLWYESNRESRIQQTREYRLAHPGVSRAASQKYRNANIDEVRQKDRDYKAKHYAKVQENHKRWLAKHPDYVKQYNNEHKDDARRRSRNWKLRCRYGISLEEFDALLASQQHLCAICGRAFGEVQRAVDGKYIDHDHSTGRVRGIVHMKCNTFIGLAGDNPAILERAALYLRRLESEYGGS